MKNLESMGNLIYAYVVEWFGGVKGKLPKPSIPIKSRKQAEIHCFAKKRRQLKKQCGEATEEEKQPKNLLQGESPK